MFSFSREAKKRRFKLPKDFKPLHESTPKKTKIDEVNWLIFLCESTSIRFFRTQYTQTFSMQTIILICENKGC